MLLFERLLFGRERVQNIEETTLLSIREEMRKAVIIDVSNVAQYYYQTSAQEVWDVREDFPNVAPPWETAWYEYRMPRSINSDGHIMASDIAGWQFGLLMCAERTDSGRGRERFDLMTAPQRAQEVLSQYVGVQAVQSRDISILREVMAASPEQLWDTLSTEQREAWMRVGPACAELLAENRWVCEGFLFIANSKGDVTAFGHFAWPVQADGSIGMKERMGEERAPIAFGPLTRDPARILSITQGMTGEHTSFLHVSFLAISFSHCRNVELLDVSPSDRLAHAQYKRAGIPKVAYKVLEIDPMRRVIQHAQQSQKRRFGNEVKTSRALHIVRGHFADYRQRGLFGRHRGIYWWDQQLRGTADAGRVEKAYRIKAGAGGRRE
jgi:hypothetical protein